MCVWSLSSGALLKVEDVSDIVCEEGGVDVRDAVITDMDMDQERWGEGGGEEEGEEVRRGEEEGEEGRREEKGGGGRGGEGQVRWMCMHMVCEFKGIVIVQQLCHSMNPSDKSHCCYYIH